MSGGITRDVWSAIQPDVEAPALRRIVTIGNRTLPAEDAEVAIGYLARAYLKSPPPAQFHFIVSPLVMWIWIGGLIAFGGGLIAISPALASARRRVSTGALSRVGGPLEAAREAKYREIRDLELDYRTGKLSDVDYGVTRRALRAEALAILDRLQRLEGRERHNGRARPPGQPPESQPGSGEDREPVMPTAS
jgi:hypothetical protein